MERLRNAKVLICGIGGLGVEIAKNLILGGIRHVTIQDTKSVDMWDLSSQYYLNEDAIGQNRATASLDFLAELNDSVTVECLTDPITEEMVKHYHVRRI